MSIDLLTIDPGYRYVAVAEFSNRELKFGDMLESSACSEWSKISIQPPDFSYFRNYINSKVWEQKRAIIEYPIILKSTPNTEDILKLTAACGAYTAILQSEGFKVVWVRPRQWKGTVPKEIMLKRIVDRLAESEYSVIANTANHNILDAVGIGLWQLKRL